MTNEEAKVFLDNLKICIDEHPVVADWLVEIANRKTEPNCSEIPNNCDTCIHNKLEWYSEVCDGCSKAHSNYEPKDEPQPFDKPPKCLGCLYSDLDKAFHPCASCVDFGKYVGEVSGKDEPQTDCAWGKDG